MIKKKIVIVSGGTIAKIAPHLALCAPAFGRVGNYLELLCKEKVGDKFDIIHHRTKMAGGSDLLTNDDVANLVEEIVADPLTKIVFFPVALCDYIPEEERDQRFDTRLEPRINVSLVVADKIVGAIRAKRKDIFLVAFKMTTGATKEEQFERGLRLVKEASANLVVANDTMTKWSMIVTPEEAAYHVTDCGYVGDRVRFLQQLIDMAVLRSHLTFTRSTVVSGYPVPWTSGLIPQTLKTVVEWCVAQGAYKPFSGATVGHFACKVPKDIVGSERDTFITSIRRSNFNDIATNGMVLIETYGPDSVTAYGAKPSVGGQSQRIVFHDHEEYDCIVHFHCPKRPGSSVNEVSQREFECGSHECGQNTSNGLVRYGNLSAVYLQNHGPNIVFHRSIDPYEVIHFIKENFLLDRKTDGLN